jgi:zinc/manganese transport system substrate-binding protein
LLHPTRRRALAVLAILAAACTPPAFAQTAPERVKVVATFSIVADLVRNVGGDRIELTTLVGPNGDAHVYSPTPSDGRYLAEAKVIVANGLGFEGWIARLIKSSGTRGAVVEAARGIAPLQEPGEAGHGHSGHDHGRSDPHAWQDIAHARIYVGNIRDALAAADPAGRAAYEANAAAYLDQLDALEAEVKEALARIPEDRRRIITSHDAFGYFQKAYGIRFIAPRGVSTEAEASAKDVARIIQQIRREKIGAVFLENVSDPRLIDRIAKETGAKVGGRLYSDALSGEGGPAATYIDMMRHNIRALGAALSS